MELQGYRARQVEPVLLAQLGHKEKLGHKVPRGHQGSQERLGQREPQDHKEAKDPLVSPELPVQLVHMVPMALLGHKGTQDHPALQVELVQPDPRDHKVLRVHRDHPAPQVWPARGLLASPAPPARKEIRVIRGLLAQPGRMDHQEQPGQQGLREAPVSRAPLDLRDNRGRPA